MEQGIEFTLTVPRKARIVELLVGLVVSLSLGLLQLLEEKPVFMILALFVLSIFCYDTLIVQGRVFYLDEKGIEIRFTWRRKTIPWNEIRIYKWNRYQTIGIGPNTDFDDTIVFCSDRVKYHHSDPVSFARRHPCSSAFVTLTRSFQKPSDWYPCDETVFLNACEKWGIAIESK